MNNQTENNTKEEERPPQIERPRRITFLLRLWCEDQAGRSNWRASLELPGQEKRIGFASLEEMFIYLIDLAESRKAFQENENERTE